MTPSLTNPKRSLKSSKPTLLYYILLTFPFIRPSLFNFNHTISPWFLSRLSVYFYKSLHLDLCFLPEMFPWHSFLGCFSFSPLMLIPTSTDLSYSFLVFHLYLYKIMALKPTPFSHVLNQI